MKPCTGLIILFILLPAILLANEQVDKRPTFIPAIESEFNFEGTPKLFQPGPGSRACCAFGTDIKLRFFPLVHIDQVIGSEELQNHKFGNKGSGKEAQGEIFTCHAGFLDSSHMRHAGDWTAYLAVVLEKYLATGRKVSLVYEGGKRWLTIHKFEGKISKRNIIKIAQRISYDTTVWHEILTWYVPAVIPIFSEKSSSFAPEDNFSNLLGTYIAANALMSGQPYKQAMVESFQKYFNILDGKNRATTKAAFWKVANKWWDSKKGLPNQWKTLKRHTNSYYRVTPWKIKNRDDLDQLGCGQEREVSLDVPQEISDEQGNIVNITSLYELDVLAPKGIPVPELLQKDGQMVSHRDYPRLVDILAQKIEEHYLKRGLKNVLNPYAE